MIGLRVLNFGVLSAGVGAFYLFFEVADHSNQFTNLRDQFFNPLLILLVILRLGERSSQVGGDNAKSRDSRNHEHDSSDLTSTSYRRYITIPYGGHGDE